MNAGANLDQINDGIPLLFEAFRSADLDILNGFLKNYKGDITSQVRTLRESCIGRYVLCVSVRTLGLNFVKRALSLLQENNIAFHKEVGTLILSTAVELVLSNRQSATADDHHQDTSMTSNECAILKYLLEQGSDVNCATTLSGLAPLHQAVHFENMELIQYLIIHGADVMVRDSGQGQTPLHWAAKGGNMEVVQCLIKHGADVMAWDKYDATPLHSAAYNGQTEVVQSLIIHGADLMGRNKSDANLLYHAANLENEDLVQCLIKNGADPMATEKDRYSPWMIACSKRNLVIMKELLNGVDLKQKLPNGRSFLHHSCLSGWIDGTKYLLENGADVNCIDDTNLTALYVIMLFNQYKHELPPDISMDNHYIKYLEISCKCWDKDVDRELMQILGDYGVDVNYRDKNRHTLLMKKEVYGQKDKREFLIQRGSDLNLVGS